MKRRIDIPVNAAMYSGREPSSFEVHIRVGTQTCGQMLSLIPDIAAKQKADALGDQLGTSRQNLTRPQTFPPLRRNLISLLTSHSTKAHQGSPDFLKQINQHQLTYSIRRHLLYSFNIRYGFPRDCSHVECATQGTWPRSGSSFRYAFLIPINGAYAHSFTVGATSGIGEYTAKAFVRNTISPHVYIVGRNQNAADRIIKECEALNRDGKVEFIKADVSEQAEVDRVCKEIIKKEKHINLLVQSQGNLNLRGRDGKSHLVPISQSHKLYIFTNLCSLAFRISRRLGSQILAQFLFPHAIHFKPPTPLPNREHNLSTLFPFSEHSGCRERKCPQFE